MAGVVTHIIAIDPGETTGWALIEHRPVSTGGSLLVDMGYMEKEPPLAVSEQIETLLRVHSLNKAQVYVVIEDMVGNGIRSTGVIHTLKLIGWLANYCKYTGLNGQMQPPQRRKAFLTKAVELAKASGRHNRHACDALAHALAASLVLNA